MRRTKYFICNRCGKEIPDYLTFGVGRRYYCLEHKPLRTRIRMWLSGLTRAAM